MAAMALASYADEKASQDEELYNALNENAPEACKSDEAPAVKFSAFDKKLIVGVTGQVKATATYDFGNVLDDADNFVSLDIPIDPDKGNGGKFMFSAQQTAVSLNVVALPNTANQIGLYITTNLLGPNYTPAIEYALLNYRGFSIGYGYTLFSDTRAAIPTIDYMGPCCYTGVGNAGIQYRKNFKCGVQIGAALELPLASYTCSETAAFVNQRVPDIPVELTYNWNGGEDWVRASAVVRNLQYRDLVAEKNIDNVGWGVQFGGSVTLFSPLKLICQATYGKGIGSYFQDYTDHGYDMMPGSTPGRLDTLEAWGCYGGLQFNFTDNVYMCGAYSHVRNYCKQYAGGDTTWGDQSKFTQYVVGNLFWDINKYLSWGVEYIWGRRVNFDKSQGHDTRLQTMLQFAF